MNASLVEQSITIAASAGVAYYMIPIGAPLIALAGVPVIANFACSYFFSAQAQQAASVVVSGLAYMIVGITMSASSSMGAILGGLFVSVFGMLFGYVLSDFA
jgi:hypothetical protein